MSKYELKTKRNDESVTKFLDSIREEQKRTDSYKILKLMTKVTKHEPKMWGTSIIGFGQYHYKSKSGQEGDWMMIGFSPRKQNLTLYIMPGFEYNQKLRDKLGKHSIGKSCLYIKRLEDIDIKVLEQIIVQSLQEMKIAGY